MISECPVLGKMDTEGKTRGYLERKQEGRCAICETKSKLVLDHNHITGEVRGMLCNNCNIGLGLFKDNPEILVRASHYIETRDAKITFRYRGLEGVA